MCKRLFLIAAVLVSAVANAQQNPSSPLGGGNYGNYGNDGNYNPLGQGNAVDCSDPLMAQSYGCTTDINSGSLRGGFPGSGGSRVTSPGQSQVFTYTDDAGR